MSRTTSFDTIESIAVALQRKRKGDLAMGTLEPLKNHLRLRLRSDEKLCFVEGDYAGEGYSQPFSRRNKEGTLLCKGHCKSDASHHHYVLKVYDLNTREMLVVQSINHQGLQVERKEMPQETVDKYTAYLQQPA